MTDYLKSKYNTPGQKEALAEIKAIANKSKLTAKQLEKLRYYADKSLPKGAYKGAEPVPVEGIENLTNPLRSKLEILDKTGKMKAANTDIRILYKLVGNNEGFLNKAAQRAMGSIPKAVGLGVATGVGYAINPVLGKAIGYLGGIDQLLQLFPGISSKLAQKLKDLPIEQAAAFIEKLLKGTSGALNTQIGK